LNFDDEELEKELYKYDRARQKYKDFEYPESDRKLNFASLSNIEKQMYIWEATNIFPNIFMDQKFQYMMNPNIYVKRYLNSKLSLKEINQNNRQQIFYAILLNNSGSYERNKHMVNYSD